MDLLQNRLNIGFLGVGSVAKYHAEVLLELGHNIAQGSAKSEKSVNWIEFEQNFPGCQFQSDGRGMLWDSSLDVVIACLPWDVMESWLPDLLASPKPILIEKPAALSSGIMSHALTNPVSQTSNKRIGYNRRFYNTVQKLKERICEGGIKSVDVMISETVESLSRIYGGSIIDHILAYSSCHVLDTLLYLVGDLMPTQVCGYIEPKYKGSFISLNAMLETLQGISVSLTIIADNPASSGIRIYFEDQTTWHLSPMEHLVAYDGYEIIEPNKESKIRRYIPNSVLMLDEDVKFKPGFLSQMEEFTSKCVDKIGATPQDHLRLLMFTEEITKRAVEHSR